MSHLQNKTLNLISVRNLNSIRSTVELKKHVSTCVSWLPSRYCIPIVHPGRFAVWNRMTQLKQNRSLENRYETFIISFDLVLDFHFAHIRVRPSEMLRPNAVWISKRGALSWILHAACRDLNHSTLQHVMTKIRGSFQKEIRVLVFVSPKDHFTLNNKQEKITSHLHILFSITCNITITYIIFKIFACQINSEEIINPFQEAFFPNTKSPFNFFFFSFSYTSAL